MIVRKSLSCEQNDKGKEEVLWGDTLVRLGYLFVFIHPLPSFSPAKGCTFLDNCQCHFAVGYESIIYVCKQLPVYINYSF